MVPAGTITPLQVLSLMFLIAVLSSFSQHVTYLSTSKAGRLTNSGAGHHGSVLLAPKASSLSTIFTLFLTGWTSRRELDPSALLDMVSWSGRWICTVLEHRVQENSACLMITRSWHVNNSEGCKSQKEVLCDLLVSGSHELSTLRLRNRI